MKNRRRSLRLRVTATASGLIAVILVVGALALAFLLRRALEQDIDSLLDDQINDVAVLAQSGDIPTVLHAQGREIGQLQVRDITGRIVASTVGFASTSHMDIIPALQHAGSTSQSVSGSKIDGDSSERYRLVERTIDTAKGRLFIYGASSLRAADAAVRTLAIALLAGVPALVGLAALILWGSVGRSLAPVDAMRAEVDDIEATSLDRRVSAPSTDDELGRLARTLNHLLGRLDADARNQRQFAADASHELRSPLAAARAQLEVGLAYPSTTNWTDTAHDVLIEVDRLERLSRELLDFARVDRNNAAPTLVSVNLAEVLSSAVASMPGATVAIEWNPPPRPVMVLADEDLLTRVCRNLLSNAQRHARQWIRVDLSVIQQQVLIRFGNDGAPLTDADREQIFEPFTRLDSARSADSGGVGLGLAIARRIAELHGGSLTADAVPHGASFTLTLPTHKQVSLR